MLFFLKKVLFKNLSPSPLSHVAPPPSHIAALQERNKQKERKKLKELKVKVFHLNVLNDPSAGSPTETLLRLLLPLSD